MAGSGRKVWAADEILAADDLQNYIQDQVVFVYANVSARSSGILAPSEGMISYLADSNTLSMFDGSAWVDVLPNVGTAGTYTKVTTDAKGRVSAGTTLSASDIPDLDAGKVTTGAFSADRIPSLDAGKVTTGAFSADRIPSLDAGKVTTGAFGVDRIPSLSAAKITSGTLTTQVITTSNCSFGSVGTASLTVDGNPITNLPAYQNAVSGLAVYISSSGVIGKGASTRTVKKDIVDAQIDTDAVLQLRVRNFVYDSSKVESDGSVQLGVIAEELVDLGLEEFVFFEAGKPSGVHYEKLALALLPVVQMQQARLDLLDARLAKLEAK